MVNNAKEVFEDKKITVVADMGYNNLTETIDSSNENTVILIKAQKGKKDKLESGFDKVNFTYNPSTDS